MEQPITRVSGNLSINLTGPSNDWHGFSVTVPDCSIQDFYNVAKNVAQIKSQKVSQQVNNWNRVSSVFSETAQTQEKHASETELNALESIEDVTSHRSHKEKVTEDYMSDFTKSELQAHLNANKAEVSAVASSMKKDMAEWREQMRSDLRDVTEAINKQNSNLDKHFHAQEVKLSSSLELQSAKFENSLASAKLDIIKWVLGLPALAFALYKIYAVLTHSPSP